MNIELYQKYFRKNNKGLVLLILIIGVGTVVNGLNPYIYGKIIDSISGKNIIILKKWLLCLGIVLIVTLILETVESLIGNWLTNIIENQIKNDLFAHITIMECKNLDIYEEGELFNKIEFDAENIVSYYLDFITSILMIVFNLGISVYFISMLQNLFSGPNTLSARPLQKGTLASSPLITLSRPMSARIRITRVTRAVMIPKIPDNTVPRKGIR